jgi:hypothetical protein
MPDLIPSGDDGQMEQQIWPHETCASCKAADSCALLAMLKDYQIMTYTGMAIFRCVRYDPDEKSPNYMAIEYREPERILAEGWATVQRETDQLILDLTEARESIWSSLNLSDTREPAPHTGPWPKRSAKSTQG